MLKSIKRFLHGVRRKKIAKAKEAAWRARNKPRARSETRRELARLMHIGKVRAQQQRGIKLADGSLASIENRWVRKALFRKGELYPSQPNYPRPKTQPPTIDQPKTKSVKG